MRNLLMCAMMTMGAGAAMAQPVQWRVQDGGNGHWYELRATAQTVIDERLAEALALGGNLVSISTAQENQFIAQLLVSKGATCRIVIGARRACDSCPWRWTDYTPWTFAAWGPGEPGNSGAVHAEMFVDFGPLGSWADVNDYDGSCTGYVLEWSADCNGDGIVDKGQILSGQFPDANNNGIPDGVSITSQPQSLNLAAGVPALFTVEVNTPSGSPTPTTFMWQRRNPLIADENAPNAWFDLVGVVGFANANTASLGIPRPTPGMATGFRCRVSNTGGCESNVVYTNTVNFTLTCPSDFNADGAVDGDDIITFFERWDGGC